MADVEAEIWREGEWGGGGGGTGEERRCQKFQGWRGGEAQGLSGGRAAGEEVREEAQLREAGTQLTQCSPVAAVQLG